MSEPREVFELAITVEPADIDQQPSAGDPDAQKSQGGDARKEDTGLDAAPVDVPVEMPKIVGHVSSPTGQPSTR